MERRLYKAALEGDLISLLDNLRDDPLILDRCLAESHSETPLHIAAMLGHEHFVAEILARKPELAREPDARKCLPLHLAVGRGHLGIVKILLSVHPDACFARNRNLRNPLHVAALKGRIDILTELVRQRPGAALDRADRGDTVLHLCVRHSNVEALKLLVDSIGNAELVNLKNEDGDTVLHLAATYNHTEALNFLISTTSIDANMANQKGFTAHDILEQLRVSEGFHGSPSRNLRSESEIKPVEESHTGAVPASTAACGFSLEEYLKLEQYISKKTKDGFLERKRNASMVVVSLTAGIAIAIGVNPPGGLWKDGHAAGLPIMADTRPVGYAYYMGVNSLSLMASLSLILLMESGLTLRHGLFTWIVTLIMWVAVMSIAVTYLIFILFFTQSPVKMAILKVIAAGIVVWILLMSPLLIGRTICLIRRAVRGDKKAVVKSSLTPVIV